MWRCLSTVLTTFDKFAFFVDTLLVVRRKLAVDMNFGKT